MTVKELREKLANLPEDAEIIIDYSYQEEYGEHDREDESSIAEIYSFKNYGTEVHFSTYRQMCHPDNFKMLYSNPEKKEFDII